jgi:vacuolar-type H+-ATPase subunit F/Vma7
MAPESESVTAAKVIAIAQGQPALELGLTGIAVEEIQEIADVEARLTDLIESDAQLIIVEERYRNQFSEWFAARLAKHNKLPLVIFCPSFSDEDADSAAYIGGIVKSAVGFEIRLD